MAWSDYKICDYCGNAKVFYDADIQDARYQATWGKPSDYDPIGLKAICGECNKTHEVVIAPRKKESADRIQELVKERDELKEYIDRYSYTELGDEAEARCFAEAKLAECEARLGKAVEALQEIASYDTGATAGLAYTAQTVLAELEGEK